jgi:amino acid transporter
VKNSSIFLNILKLASKLNTIEEKNKKNLYAEIIEKIGQKEMQAAEDIIRRIGDQLDEREADGSITRVRDDIGKYVAAKFFLATAFIYLWVQFSPDIDKSFSKIFFKVFYVAPDSALQHPIALLNVPSDEKLNYIKMYAESYLQQPFNDMELLIMIPLYVTVLVILAGLSSFLTELYRSWYRKLPSEFRYIWWINLVLNTLLCAILISSSFNSIFPDWLAGATLLAGLFLIFNNISFKKIKKTEHR